MWPGCYNIHPLTFSSAILQCIATAPNILHHVNHYFLNHSTSDEDFVEFPFLKFLNDTMQNGIQSLTSLFIENNQSLDEIFDSFIPLISSNLAALFLSFSVIPALDSNLANLPEAIDSDYNLIYNFDGFQSIPETINHHDFTFFLTSLIAQNKSGYTTFAFSNDIIYRYKDGNVTIYKADMETIFQKYTVVSAFYSCFFEINFTFEKKPVKRKISKKKVIIEFPEESTPTLEESFKKGEEYEINDLILKIDEVSRKENRFLYTKSNTPSFRYICDCGACVKGKQIISGKIQITYVQNHSCPAQGYMPKKLKTKEIASHFQRHNTAKEAFYDYITHSEDTYKYSYVTFTRYLNQNEGTSSKILLNDWKKIPSIIDLFTNETKSNTFLKYSEDEDGKMIQSFFILPTEAIEFLNSCLFTGLIIADGTFLKFFKLGELIIFVTYLGTHQSIIE